MLSAAAAIGPNERLIILYQTELDADSQNNIALTNIAGATQWFDADINTPRQTILRSPDEWHGRHAGPRGCPHVHDGH